MRPGFLRPAPCRRAARELQRYLDGESEAGAGWSVARHLARCEDCYDDADVMSAIKEAVARLRVPPDAEALARLRRVIGQE